MPRKYKHWTAEEDKIILENAESHTNREIAEMLPGRGVNNVKERRVRIFAKNGIKKTPKVTPNENSYEQGDKFINIVCASERMLTKDEVLKQFNVDLEIWEVERFRVKTSEGYRKDRSVIWKVVDGQVVQGDVNDSGKMLVVPLYHIEVRLKKKEMAVKARSAMEILVENAGKYAPKYEKIRYQKPANGMLFEIAMPDIHFGRLCWGEESGENYDIQIAKKAVLDVIGQFLQHTKLYPVEKILLPIGNDFFNSDTLFNTTTRGTPQQEDVRWQKTFQRGCELAIAIIDKCAAAAPVDVEVIPGNHDSQRAFFLGEALKFWYRSCSNVRVDNSAKSRKYYTFGKCLVGFCHGYSERLSNLPLLMATEEPDLWAKSVYREWHTGDKHHKKDMVTTADEDRGVIVRILRSLVPFDAWTFNSGFIKPLKAAEAFMWDKERGLVAQFTAMPRERGTQRG